MVRIILTLDKCPKPVRPRQIGYHKLNLRYRIEYPAHGYPTYLGRLLPRLHRTAGAKRLGLDAQKAAVAAYMQGQGELEAEFVEMGFLSMISRSSCTRRHHDVPTPLTRQRR